MSKNVNPIVIGMASTLIVPMTSLAYNEISSTEDLSNIESSNLSRAISSLDKWGVVTGVAKNDYLNVRSSATTASSSFGKILNGETVIITGQDGEWYRIDYKGKTGYVYNKYIKVSGNISYKKTTDNLNMRLGASTSTGIITKIPNGTTVKVISSSNGWDKVYYGGNIGFCSNKYLKNATSSASANDNSNTTNSTLTSMNKEGQVIGVATNDTLNVRSSADAKSSIVTKIANSTKVQVIGQDTKTGWYKITYNGKTGYVNNKYIKIIGDWNASTPSIIGTRKTTTNLNFRTGPSTSHSLISTIPSGTTVDLYSVSNGWAKIRYNGKDGYVSNAYLTTSSSSNTATNTTKKVTTTDVNMRTGASTSYSIIKKVASNTVVEVLGTSNGWDKVKVGNDTGYIKNSYLKAYNGSTNDTTNLPSSKPLYSKVKVVVDAGHGGTDPGAIGNGRKEKDIVLSISNKVNSKLKSMGFQTIMTRSTDVYVTLANRYAIANNNKADLFVSIHANSGASSAKGIETLYKNYKGLAESIQSNLIAETGATNRGVKYRSDLAVLNGTKMASALVEVGFISNPTESSQIGTNSYQEKLATAIVKGVAKYTDNNIKK